MHTAKMTQRQLLPPAGTSAVSCASIRMRSHMVKCLLWSLGSPPEYGQLGWGAQTESSAFGSVGMKSPDELQQFIGPYWLDCNTQIMQGNRLD